ncbi:hypothetical protein K7432_006367 [Basidiobolus ranarum]|uniref:BHLH domain-containing protein n=1 Tax=Basidiobolus ranarum TaxID=34480 RepID=A0ABR2W1S5_9FUNG
MSLRAYEDEQLFYFPYDIGKTKQTMESLVYSEQYSTEVPGFTFDPLSLPAEFFPADMGYVSLPEASPESSTASETFLSDFPEYSQEILDQLSNGPPTKRKRSDPEDYQEVTDELSASEQSSILNSGSSGGLSNAEIRRQIHIQSEQKRRAQIKDGFEELKCHLPNCSNKKISKAAILYKTVQYLQHLKNIQIALIAQLEHMGAENERLKQFCDVAIQKQSLEKVYSIGL